MNAILEVSGLVKTYNRFKLDHLDFSLQEGCITGFIGANGSGKTTTIKSILGLTIPDEGTVRLMGQELAGHEREFKDRIGVVLDEGYFYDGLSLREMKSIIAPAYSRWDEAAFNSYTNRFGLRSDQKIAELSKGMRMKYALALALSHHAEVLVMDEPTSGLDPLTRRELMEILLEFMGGEGKSVFFSTHVTSDLDKVADTLMMIDRGKLLFHEDKDQLLERHSLVKGDKGWINEQVRELFISLHVTEYGFTGLTARRDEVLRSMNGALLERPAIEDIMLAYVGR
ncbi:MAG: ecsA [Paenibacillaceae bacterium]|jgi:ABC-2 type transport system ATP-binding protein|nr:ecsA [Paenibacillaceae bacterium]